MHCARKHGRHTHAAAATWHARIVMHPRHTCKWPRSQACWGKYPLHYSCVSSWIPLLALCCQSTSPRFLAIDKLAVYLCWHGRLHWKSWPKKPENAKNHKIAQKSLTCQKNQKSLKSPRFLRNPKIPFKKQKSPPKNKSPQKPQNPKNPQDTQKSLK